jgi:hypothetical protein
MQRTRTSRLAAAVTTLLLASLVAAALVVAFRDGPPQRALAAPAAEQVANDNFDAPNFHVYGELPFESHQQTAGATLEAGETAPCGAIGATVWYAFTPQTQGTVEITTAGSSFDTIEAVYTLGNGFIPSPPGANLNSVACSDDAGGPTSFISMPIARGTTYYIQMGGKDGATGDLAFRIACNPACPPPNDDSSAALGVGVSAYGPTLGLRADTRAATAEASEPRPCGNIGKTVWYQLYADNDETLVADTAGSGFDTVIAAYSYGPTFPTSPPGGFTPLTCNDNSGGGAQSRITFDAKQGNTYWIQAGGANGASGDLSFNLSCDPACPPFNDSMGRQLDSPPFDQQTPTGGATLQDGEPRPCGVIGKTVWYGVSVSSSVTLVADTASSDFSTVIAAYDAPYGEEDFAQLHRLACDAGAGGVRARISFHASSDRLVFVQVGGRNGASGLLNLRVECDPMPCPPQNDTVMSAQYVDVLHYFPFNGAEDTRGATVDADEPLGCGNMAHTVWYQLPASQAATLEFDTAGSDYETALAVYTGGPNFEPPAASAQPVACDVSSGERRARIQFRVEPNATVYLQVGAAHGGAGGQLQLEGNCMPACPPHNDNGASATYFDPLPDWQETVDTTGATMEPGEPRRCGNIGATVWYRVHAVEGGRVRVTTISLQFATVLAVYEAAAISPPGAITDIGCSDAAGGPSLEFDVAAGKDYWIQAGGVAGARGVMIFKVACLAGCPMGADGLPIDYRPFPRGSIAGPDTGSGGYLPGARRH